MSLGMYNTERRRISGDRGWCYCLKVEVVRDLVGDVLSDRLTAIVDEPIDHVPRNILPHTDSVRKRTISHIQNGLYLSLTANSHSVYYHPMCWYGVLFLVTKHGDVTGTG